MRRARNGARASLLVCQILCTFSHPILFINFAYTFVSTSIQRSIFPSRHTANTRLFWLILLNHYMAPSNVLPSSNRVTKSLRRTTQEIGDKADSVRAASRSVQNPVISTPAISTWIWSFPASTLLTHHCSNVIAAAHTRFPKSIQSSALARQVELGREVRGAASLLKREVCMSASRIGIARSWVDWKGGNGLDVVEPQRSQNNQKSR